MSSKAYDARGRVTVETIGARLDEDPANPTSGYITRTEYNALGAPTALSDPEGRLTAFTYYPGTTNPHLQTLGADANNATLGDKTTYTYHPGGEISTITDAQGNTTTFTHNYSFRDPAYPGAVKEETTTVTDATRGVLRASRSLYDAQENRLAEIVTRTLPDGVTEEEVVNRFTYDSENRLISTFLPDGRVMETRYNSIGKEAATLHWQSTADYQSGNLALARLTAMQYDDRGNLIRTTHPDGTREETAYDAENRTIAKVDRAGRVTYQTYDKVGRLRFTIFPDGDTPHPSEISNLKSEMLLSEPALSNNPRRETRYDLIGRVVAEIDERGGLTEYTYEDGCGCAQRRKEVIRHTTDEQGQPTTLVTHYEYDRSGNVRFVTDPRDQTVETQYDHQNRPRFVIYPATDEHPVTQTETVYDSLGRRKAVIDLDGKVTRNTFDALGRLVEVRQYLDASTAQADEECLLPPDHPQLVLTRYTYDALGNLQTQTDALGHTTTFLTDALGRRTSRILPKEATEPEALVESLTYDGWGRLATRTDFKGRTTTHTYWPGTDSLREKIPDPALGETTVTYAYHPDGRRAAMTDATGTSSYFYDLRGRLSVKIHSRLGYIQYRWDDASNLTGIETGHAGGARLTYAYDKLNRLTKVWDLAAPDPGQDTPVAAYAYDPNGNLAEMRQGNGLLHRYEYDTRNRLRSLQVEKESAPLYGYEYPLSAGGQRLQAIESSGSISQYSYDYLNRLSGEAIHNDPHSISGAVSYTLDKTGNRLARYSTLAGLPSQSLTYNVRDWLGGDTYDNNGNTIAGEVGEASVPNGVDRYDFENRLLSRTLGDGTVLSYTYDGDGVRLSKTVARPDELPQTSHFVVDGLNPTGYTQVLEKFSEDPLDPGSLTLVAVAAYGLDLICRDQIETPGGSAWQRVYYGCDGHGNTRYLTDATGSITDTYDYDAFGNLLSRSGATNNPYLYCGDEYDSDLGLYYLRARWMNTATGRFWTMDSYEGNSADPISLHKYLYANGNGVMFVDYSGYGADPTLASQNIAGSVGSMLGRLSIREVVKKVGKKAGCELFEIAVEETIGAGIYIFFEEAAIYVGKSIDIERRIKQHGSDRVKLLFAKIKFLNLKDNDLRKVEQLMLDEIRLALDFTIDDLKNVNPQVANERSPTNKSIRKKIRETVDLELCK